MHEQTEYMMGYLLIGALVVLGMLVVCVPRPRKKADLTPEEQAKEDKRKAREKKAKQQKRAAAKKQKAARKKQAATMKKKKK